MNNCSNPQAPNTTIPHLLPFLLILEKNLDDFLSHNNEPCRNIMWETGNEDFGLGTLLSHLEAARKFLSASTAFQRNAEIVLDEARMEELTLEMFRTEFQMKFLWGSRGAYAASTERHSKFQQVLNVMADKYCHNFTDQSEV